MKTVAHRVWFASVTWIGLLLAFIATGARGAEPSLDDAAWKSAVNLLALVDPQKDSVSGNWTKQDGALVAGKASFQRLEIPYTPPEEYDFLIEFASERNAVVQILSRSSRSFAWIMDGWRNSASGFDLVAGVTGDKNSTSVHRAGDPDPDHKHISVVTVRRDGVKAYRDGKLVSQWQTNYRDLDLRPDWKLRNPALLGLGSHGGVTTFYRVQLREITGTGRLTRADVPIAPIGTATAHPAWQPVPPMEWTGIKPSDFSDLELDVPYHLHHFHRIANAVVETGENRGFPDIAVSREPRDNKPYNARILEMHEALAYFYTVDRPWNRYRSMAAVRDRLEAMLEFWCQSQKPNGMFAEYSPDGVNLAATGFGVRAMSATLEMLQTARPGIRPELLERVWAAQRKGIMAILTSDRCFAEGRNYSNQYSGVYAAALSYLRIKSDPELAGALASALQKAEAEQQSPVGFMYEASGMDFGYTAVHDWNLRFAWAYFKEKPELADLIVKGNEKYNRWLGFNYLLQPDGRTYLLNAGIETRTSHNMHVGNSRPLAERVELSRAFAMTDEDAAGHLAERRKKLEMQFGRYRELVVPSPYSYKPDFPEEALRKLDSWYPTKQQQSAAIARLPYFARKNFTIQLHDPFPFDLTYVRRPAYYAAFNAGRIRNPRQVYGLGLLWSERMGAVLQSVAGTEFAWGTRPENGKAVYETKDLPAKIEVGGQIVRPKVGQADLPNGVVVASYTLGNSRRKVVTFSENEIEVSVEHAGGFVEQLPLVMFREDSISQEGGKLTLSHGGQKFVATFSPGSKVELRPAADISKDLVRVMVLITAQNKLKYTLAFTDP